MTVAATTWDAALVERAVEVGIVMITVGALLCLFRLVRGPHLADRAIALDTIAIHLIGLVILLTLRINSMMLFDGALVLSLVGFAGTVAVAQYIVRPYFRRQAPSAARDDHSRSAESTERRTSP